MNDEFFWLHRKVSDRDSLLRDICIGSINILRQQKWVPLIIEIDGTKLLHYQNYSICVPHLTYSCEIISYTSRQMQPLNVAMNDSIRRIFGYNRWESVRHLRTVKLRNNGSAGTDCIIPLLPKSGIAKMTFVIVRETVFCHWKKNLMIY